MVWASQWTSWAIPQIARYISHQPSNVTLYPHGSDSTQRAKLTQLWIKYETDTAESERRRNREVNPARRENLMKKRKGTPAWQQIGNARARASGDEWERASGGLIRDGRGGICSGHSAETWWKTSQIIQLSTHPSQFEAALTTLWYDSGCRIHDPLLWLDFSNSHPAKCKSLAGANSLSSRAAAAMNLGRVICCLPAAFLPIVFFIPFHCGAVPLGEVNLLI